MKMVLDKSKLQIWPFTKIVNSVNIDEIYWYLDGLNYVQQQYTEIRVEGILISV